MVAGFKYLILLLLTLIFLSASSQVVVIKGCVTDDSTGTAVEGALIKLSHSSVSAVTDKKGMYTLHVARRPVYYLNLRHTSYEPSQKFLKDIASDSLFLNVRLKSKSEVLAEVPVYALQKPETLVGKPNYGIYDFDFFEEKLILLTAEKSLSNAQVRLADYEGNILSTYRLPLSAGPAQHFFHDYEGYPDLICRDSVFRIEVQNSELIIRPIPRRLFLNNVKSIADTVSGNFYFSDAWEKYPSMNYYYAKNNDSVAKLLQKITNEDLLKLYNLEYYYLPSRMQLEARRMADRYKTDKHVIAALMSGFTGSMYYEPLYAPLFVLADTICIFNHHNDQLYHYNKKNELIDSVSINYHHPDNWREWKKQLFVDELENKVYALFSKNGHHSLKQINHRNGEIMSTYKLKHHSAVNIKIRDGYVYYVYRPFESTQEKFLYREKIR
jgi:hypothetical protein